MIRFLAVTVLAALTVWCLNALGPARGHWRPGTVHNREHAIVHAFCGSLKPCWRGNEALTVAYCESGPNLWNYAVGGAGNDHYGMFQFGSWARSTFGFSWSPWFQARAAFRYYRVSGWTGWSCQP